MANKSFKSFQEVPVWDKSHRLTLKIYIISQKFPKTEMFGLTSQIRRASSSIPANIAEGFYRNTTKELIQYLYQARGSCGETIYHLILAKDLGYLSENQHSSLKEEYNNVGKQLNGWIKSLKEKLIISH